MFPKGVHERSLSDPSAAPDPLYAIIGVIGEDGAEQLSQAAREVVRLMGERRLPPSESGVGLEEAGVVVKGIALRRPVLARLRFTARPGQEGHGGAANEAMGLLRAGHQSRLWESVLTVNVTPEVSGGAAEGRDLPMHDSLCPGSCASASCFS